MTKIYFRDDEPTEVSLTRTELHTLWKTAIRGDAMVRIKVKCGRRFVWLDIEYLDSRRTFLQYDEIPPPPDTEPAPPLSLEGEGEPRY